VCVGFGQQTHVEHLRKLRLSIPDLDSDFGSSIQKKSKTAPDNFSEQWKSLGFLNTENPEQDFQAPPGILSLENMGYLAKKHAEDYSKVRR
jgi:hypothetical protein